MLVFGHAGLTVGAAMLARGVLNKIEPKQASRFTFWLKSLDLRFLTLGSLLPDIIDKPLGLILFARSIGYGRIFCHSLLFLILITAGGLWLYHKRGRHWLFTLALGTASHLVLDEMWAYPVSLFWPLYGMNFPREEPGSYLLILLHELLTEPKVYIPEMVGILVFVILALRLPKDVRRNLSLNPLNLLHRHRD
ncbi:MAG: metal-dependent hydrolase [Chloroflexota bacterium]